MCLFQNSYLLQYIIGSLFATYYNNETLKMKIFKISYISRMEKGSTKTKHCTNTKDILNSWSSKKTLKIKSLVILDEYQNVLHEISKFIL